MKFQTFSVVIGDNTCNAHCPYCVSKMTPCCGVGKEAPFNDRNLHKACQLAVRSGVTTALITGKGEPTLYPELISKVIKVLNEYFPLIELQTNGLWDEIPRLEQYLDRWGMAGLNTIALSIVHYDQEKGKKLCGFDYDLWERIKLLHKKEYSVRLSCLLIKGYIDSIAEAHCLIEMAKLADVEQLTFRTLERTEHCNSDKICSWIDNHRVSNKEIKEHFDRSKKHLLNLVHGAKVYDVNGQNVCLTNALTITPNPDEIRQLIYFPDGHLRYDWQYKGAIIL